MRSALPETNTTLLQRIAKAKRRRLASLIREGVMEWLNRRSYLQDEEKKTLGVQPDLENLPKRSSKDQSRMVHTQRERKTRSYNLLWRSRLT